MTYFETPNDQQAYFLGMTVEAYENMIDAQADDEAAMWDAGQPHLEVEDRDLIPEADVALVSERDRADLQTVLDWESFEGFGN